MGSIIRGRAGASSQMLGIFSDEATLSSAVSFEVELARATAAEGLFSTEKAALVAAAGAALNLVPAEIAEEAAFAGTLAIPLVRRLREAVAAMDPSAAEVVHLGSTSQDLADTVMVMQMAKGLVLIKEDLAKLADALARLAQTHAATPMLGRTLMQGAGPITFGLKAANWMLGVDSAKERLNREAQAALLVELGGAVGTRAGLQGKGAAIERRLARALGLAAAPSPWHSRRDAIAGLAAALGITVGVLAKLARDIGLLAQSEVGEVAEPLIPGRGGSSAMPHKRNPTGCQIVLSNALRTPGLVATVLSALPQEHERGLGGWQAEGPVMAELFELTHGAIAALAPVAEGLEVNSAAMAANLHAADCGEDAGESAALVAAALERHGRGPNGLRD